MCPLCSEVEKPRVLLSDIGKQSDNKFSGVSRGIRGPDTIKNINSTAVNDVSSEQCSMSVPPRAEKGRLSVRDSYDRSSVRVIT